MSVKFLNSILTNIEDTLEKTSEYKEKNSSMVKTMSNSQFLVINFDKVKKQYTKNKGLNCEPASVDALFDIGQEIVFVEFKSRKIGEEVRKEVAKKFYETAFILTNLVPNQFSIDYFKRNAVFILVFDSSKNPYKYKLQNSILNKALMDRFSLAYIQNFCCKEFHAFDQQQFSSFLQKNGIP